MKIAVAGPVGSFGGLQTHHKMLKAFLVEEGHKLLAIDVELAPVEKENLRQQNSKLRNRIATLISASLNLWLRVVYWGSAVLRLRSFKPDILISLSNGYGFALLGLFARSQCFTVRTEVVDSWTKGDLLHEISARLYDATAVQSFGLLLAQRTKISGHHPTGVLPCFAGINEGSEICGRPNGAILRIAFFGRLASNKGLEELIQAIAGLDDKEYFTLDIWGSGSMQSKVSDAINVGNLKDVVYLKGNYPVGDDFRKLLSSYHGLILPSQSSEGLPLILLEAASVGLPFLSCDVGAIADTRVDNPDVKIISIGVSALKLGLIEWLQDLNNGEYKPERLKKWYFDNHCHEKQKHKWKEMILKKNDYFTI